MNIKKENIIKEYPLADRVMTSDELFELFHYLDFMPEMEPDSNWLEFSFIIKFILLTGLRVPEVLGEFHKDFQEELTKEECSFSANLIVTRSNARLKKERVIYVPVKFARELDEYLNSSRFNDRKAQNSNLASSEYMHLFLNKWGKPISTNQIKTMWETLCMHMSWALSKKYYLHNLREMFTVNSYVSLINSGVSSVEAICFLRYQLGIPTTDPIILLIRDYELKAINSLNLTTRDEPLSYKFLGLIPTGEVK